MLSLDNLKANLMSARESFLTHTVYEKIVPKLEPDTALPELEQIGKFISIIEENFDLCGRSPLSPDIKSYYTQFFGWVLPSQDMLDAIKRMVRKFTVNKIQPEIIDFGAGTGILTKILRTYGLKVHAVDDYSWCQFRQGNDFAARWDDFRPRRKSSGITPRLWEYSFVEITKVTDTFRVLPEQILLISWGSCDPHIIDTYISDGGRCVIIIGDVVCAISPDYVSEKFRRKFQTIKYPLPSFPGHRTFLTVNIRVYLKSSLQ